MSRMIVRRKPATAKCGIEAGEVLGRRLMRFAHQSLALLLSGLLIFQPMIANAQSISASTTAPVANQPSVGAAPNGVPLVDIVTPNAAGLSHNKYDNFNVGTQGAILNNFKGEQGTSNLGGVTPGNPNLNASNPASVILNEVTSGNRSALNGPTEVFGTKADVIVANPNGITCNGCGFINTPHATLTTGVPTIGADGSLTGFTVNGGDVTFEGAGGNFAASPGSVDLFDVVSRSIHVNGPVYGKTLRLTAGANKYDYATGEATALTSVSGTPEYAIDGTALGAMQADRIKIVVTEKGAGVNMSGDMAANAGDLTLSADGKISIGNVSGSQGVSITSKSKVTAAKVTSKAKLAIQADSGITLQSVAANDDIALSSGAGLLSVTGDVNSATNVAMTSAGGISGANVTAGGTATLSASAGNISLTGVASSKGALSITATSGSISAASLLSYNNIGLDAGLDISVVGTVFAQGKIAATGRSISTGATVSGLDIAATQADAAGKTVLASAADLQLTATGGAVNAASLLSSGNITVDATSLTAQTITGHGAITINATRATAANGLVNVSGQILGGSDIAISGAGIQATTIASGVDFTATDAAGGHIALGNVGALDLTAAAGTVDVGTLLSAGDLTAQAALLQADNLTSHGNVHIDAGVDVASQLLGAGAITINGNTNGVSADLLASGVDFAATKAAGGNIVLASSGDLTIDDSAGAVQIGTILAAGTIDAVGQTITADTVTGHKDITLAGATSTATGSGRVDVSGQVLGGGNVSVSGSSIAADAIVSGVDIAATDTAGGTIVLGTTAAGTGNLTLTASGALTAGTLLSSGDLNASAASITADNISAHGDMTLGGAISVSDQILGAGNVAITGQSLAAQTLVAGIDFDATNAAGGTIVLTSSGDLTVAVSGAITAPTTQAAGNLNASGATITADAITAHKDITLAGATNVSGQVLGGSDIDISGSSIKAGVIVSAVDFAATAAANGAIVQTTSGDLTLASTGNIDIGTLLSAGDLDATGTTITADVVTARGDMMLGGAIDVSGQILGSGNVSISGQSLSAQTLVAGIDFDATNTSGGTIVLGQTGDLTVAVSGAAAASTIQAAGAIDVSAATVTADAITGHKDITLAGATTVNGQVLGGGDISISGSSIKAGTIVSGVDFAATAASGSGIVLASSGDLSLTATGIINASTLLSAGDLGATGSTITADGITAHGDVTLGGAISVTDQILGSGNVLITGQSLAAQTLVAGIDFDATDAAGGNIVLGQTGDLTVAVSGAAAASTIEAAGTIDVTAASVTADAITGHGAITLSGATSTTTASGRVDISGQVLGGNDMSISGSSIKAGAVVSGVDFAATSAGGGNIVLANGGDLTLASTGIVDAGTLLSAGDLNVTGTSVSADSVTAHGDIMLGGAIDVSGQILGSGNLSISGQSLSAQTLVAGIDFDATNTSGGNIVLGQAGDLMVSVSGAAAASTIQAAGAIDVNAATVTADTITGHQDITLAGATTVNGQVLGGGDVSISGSSIKAGTIVSGVDFAATSAGSGNIVLANNGDLTLTASGALTAGTLLSAGDLSAAGSTVTADAVTSHGDVILGGAISVSGQILGAGNVSITGQSLSAQTLIAGIDFDATNAASGNIVLGQTGDLTISVSGDAAASTIQAAGAIDITATSFVADAVTGRKDVTLAGATGTTASGRVDISGQVLGGGNIDISGSSITASALVSGVDFAATAAAGGNIVLASSGDLTLASTGNIDAGTLLSAGDLSAAGTTVTADSVTAHGDMTLGGAIVVNGQILGAGNVLITGPSLSAQTLVAGIDFDATNAVGGDIVLGQTGDLTVAVSGSAAASTMEAAGTTDVSAATVTADAITAHKDITLSGATNINGQVLGGGDITISGSSITAGAVVSGADFASTAAASGNIVQTSVGDVSLTSTGDLAIGTLLSAGDLTAQALDLTAGSITGHGAVDLKASGTTTGTGRVDVSGQVLSAGNLTIDGSSLSVGLLVSGVDFAATDAAGGNIVLGSSGAMNLTASGNATAGTILSAGDFTATAADLQAGSVTSHGKVGINGDVDVTSQILAAGDLTINGGSISAPVLISGIDFAATTAAGGNIVLGSSGAMNLTATGDIVSQTMLSAGDFTAQAANLQADSITSHGKVGILGNVDVGNQVLAAGNLTINGGSISAPTLISGIDFAATNAAGGSIVLASSGAMDLDASAGIATSTMLSAGDIDASAATITAGAVTAHGDVTLAGSSSVIVTGQLLSADDISLSGQTVQVSQAVTGVDFAATAQSSNGAIALGSGGALDIVATSVTAGTLIVAGSLDVAASAFTGGNITSHGTVAIGASTSPGAVAINGQLLGASDVSITGSAISGNVIVAGVDFTATSQSASGNIVLGNAGDLTLKATSGDIAVNSLMAAGSITTNAAGNVSTNAVAHGDLTVNAGNAITLSGQSLAARNANLAARSMTINSLVSGVDFAATSAASGGSLMLQHTGAMTLAASSGSINANVLLSGGSLAATATQNIGYASLQSLGNATLTAPGSISYTSTTRVGGNLTLNTGALDLSGSRGSAIAGAGTLIVNASSANLSGSNLVFGGLTLNLSGNADLSNADVSAVTNGGGSGDITVSAAGLTTTAGTSLLAAHDLTLNLPSLGNAGQLAAANDLTFNISGDFYNSPSGLVFAGNNANFFVGGVLTNDQGALLSGNGLAIAGPGGGRNGAVVNSAGLIQSGGSMSILTNGLTNTTTSGPVIQRNVQISNTILSAYDLITETYKCETRCGTGSGQHEPTYAWTETVDHLVSQIVSQDQLISGAGASAKIRAGGPLTINAINLTNAYSSIESDSNMLLTVAGTLTNDGTTLNRTTTTTCDSSTPCQYYPDVIKSDTTQGGPDCSGPNNPCIGSNDPSLTYSNNPNGHRDASKDLAAGSTVSLQAIGAISGVIEARGALVINGGGTVNNVAANGSINGGVAIDAAATASNPLGALNSMTAGGALFNVNASLASVAANGGASLSSGPSLASTSTTIASGPTVNGSSLTAGSTSISSGSLTANGSASVDGNSVAVANGVSISGGSLTANGSASLSGNGVTAAGGPSINSTALTTGGASVNPNSLMGKLTAAIGNSGNLAQMLQVNGAQLASLAKPQSGGVGGTVPGQVFLFETRAAFLDVSKFYGSAYFIDRIGYTPETQVPFLGDAYFDNQLVDEQMRQLVGDGLGAGSFIPGNNATDQMKTLLDNGVAYAEANGLALGQELTPEQAASLSQSIVIYQAEIVDGAQVLVPVVYLSAADRAKVNNSAAVIAGNTVSIDAGSVDNSGAIAAADGMTINATDIKANGGVFLAGGNMNLNASNGITLAAQTMNIGGQTVVASNGGVTAGGNLKMDAGSGSLTLTGTKVAAGGSAELSGKTVTLGAVKQDNGGTQALIGTTVTTGGNLSIAGTNSVNIIASSAKVGGDLSVLSSNGSVNVISAGVENTVLTKDRLSLAQGGTITTTTSQIQQGSSLIAGGAMTVSGNQGVLIAGSTLDAKGNLGIVSTNGNIAITATQDQTTSQSKTIAGVATGYKGGSASSTSVTSNGSSITSGNGSATVQADNGAISVIGSDIAAKGGTANLTAKGDITIGEATDSASSSSKSGNTKSSETTTTAEGSSISGQTGVTIASTGGNVTISASDVTAGDATHTANADIKAAGNIVIASGKDTDETTSDSKSSGFLSSSKTHTHTYDEDTVGSSISASGNVNVAAGGEAVISGSSVTAGNDLSLSGSTVTVMAAEEEHESDKQTKKSGIGVGSGGGFISIYGSHDKTISESSTDNVGSTLTAANGNITLNATKGDLNIIGSSIAATNGDVTGTAAGDINILPGHESDDTSKSDKRSGFGIQVSTSGGGASIGIGVGRFTDQVNQSADTNAVSTINAGGDITLKAGDTFNDQAGQITAGGGVNITGANGVNILSGNDVTNFDEVATSFFAGVSVGVSSSFVGAGQSIENLASKLGNVTDGYSAANVAFAGMKAYEALSNLQDSVAAGNLASVSLTAGFTYSKNETSVSSSTPVLPTISGSSVDISTNGDFVSRGLQISAQANPDRSDDMNGSLLISANNIDMAGAQATTDASSRSESAGASIGVSVGVGIGGATGITPTASVSAGQSKSSSSSTTQVISTVSASNNIKFVSKGDTTLNNTVFSADAIDGEVGGNLSIVSMPNTGTQSNSSTSLGFSFTGGTIGKTDGQDLLTASNVGTALGGLTLGGVQPGFGSGKGSTNWIDTPAGLYSTGDQNITVGKNTNLAAAGLISTDGQVNLDTGTLTWSDFVGSQKYQGYQVDANIDLYGGADANGKTQNNSSAEGKYQLDDVEQSVKATISGSGGAGNITIRNPDQQAALEQSGQTGAVDQINTDPTQQNVVTKDKHIDLEPYVSVQSVTAAIDAGKTIMQALGDALDKMSADGKLSPQDNQTIHAIAQNPSRENLKAIGECAKQRSGSSCSVNYTTVTGSVETATMTADGAQTFVDGFVNSVKAGLKETAGNVAWAINPTSGPLGMGPGGGLGWLPALGALGVPEGVVAQDLEYLAEAGEAATALEGPAAGTQAAWSGAITAGTVPEGGMVAYRIWGGGSSQLGGWLSPILPESSAAARSLLALPPANSAQFVSKVFIPAGTQIQYGVAASAFGQTGGGIQILLLDRIPMSNFGPGLPY
ncbi:hemagglutinin repeat-containing protein [Rhizobium sp. CNPSo 3464]|uniref:two-partner secretion domain-containing protein n=1 Tax=Rhizobium sp. CNPSo 3464 TaxID=3021406 RepID=UPI00254C16F3|nr:hemagglutinin repeat-containing protein [Rhizobium sp. CNPSo 3464]MDK4741396.1 hemagglutinin repeat-containing protein [Rhizobium sp. CNPSo 3464]